MRIRVQESDLAVDMVEALGATAIPIAYGDVYASLERQVVDGAENNWPSYEAMRHYEVAKYYTVDEHSRVPEMQICSAYTWQKLSPEDREIILECARESALYEREVWTQREEQSRSIAMKMARKWWSFPQRKRSGSRMPCTGYMKNTAGMIWDSSKKF